MGKWKQTVNRTNFRMETQVMGIEEGTEPVADFQFFTFLSLFYMIRIGHSQQCQTKLLALHCRACSSSGEKKMGASHSLILSFSSC